MGSAERRQQILRTLCRRRFETIENLAVEFGVSSRTIRRDVETLSLSAPIYTQAGRYGGGVYVMEGYDMGGYMSDEESAVIHKLCTLGQNRLPDLLSEKEWSVLKTIQKNYCPPRMAKVTAK